jgi:integrase
MPSVYPRGSKWYLRVKDSAGHWKGQASKARTKTAAKRLASELEQKYERERYSLEARPSSSDTETLDDLLAWWLATYSAPKPSHAKNSSTVRRHLIGSDLGGFRVREVTAGRVEVFLQAKASEVGPQTLNHLRGFISRAFNCARRAGRFTGMNPASDVQKRRIPQRLPDYLKAHEVAPVLKAVPDHWRALFATAVYSGLRKGELIGLRKVDVDLTSRLLTVARSYDRETTKGGRTEVIPIAAELVPYLQGAIDASPSELVFPRPDGSMMSEGVQLELVLRRALRKAGIVTGYRHVCRRKDCGHREAAPDAVLRRCPKDNRRLWLVAESRPIRFHALRHTTASLLLMSGANPAAVQRIMRHSDPRLTMGTYGHLAPDYLKGEIDRLVFGETGAPHQRRSEAVASVGSAPFATPLLQGTLSDDSVPFGVSLECEGLPLLTSERATGVEPATFSLGICVGGSRYSGFGTLEAHMAGWLLAGPAIPCPNLAHGSSPATAREVEYFGDTVRTTGDVGAARYRRAS